MITIGIMLFGGFIGLWLHHYVSHFAHHVSYAVYRNYVEIFAANRGQIAAFSEHRSRLVPIKCGAKKWFFLLAAAISLLCYFLLKDGLLSVLVLSCLAILFAISLLDWHYQLIDISLAQILIVLGMIAGWRQIVPLTLEQSLQSAVLSFVFFWLFYHAAQCYYRQEALGRGDYWLIAGLSAFLPLQDVPFMLLLACISGLIYAVIRKLRNNPLTHLPFAPFLSLGGIFTFLLNVLA
ncbi:A24 family peptidase [Pasteurellaceae bacterium LIM206]|nr:A24 family peptidase [Pasteurellaceae bacterium LIM206]